MQQPNAPAPNLDAPIPGQSLTAPLGGRPWQKPPRFSTADSALAFYLKRISGEKQVSQMLDVLELGVPVDSLVNMMTLSGVMEGLHSADVKTIIEPALAQAISQIADEAEVKYTLLSEEENTNEMPATEVALLAQAAQDKEEGVTLKEKKVDEPKPEVQEKPRGLMSRRESDGV